MFGDIKEIFLYVVLFFGLYIQVFLLVSFFSTSEHDQEDDSQNTKKLEYPPVGIIIPCYNEEKTVAKTLDSLLALEYPREKLFLIAVDDGSQDTTWSIIKDYQSRFPEIIALQKENEGSKYAALNFGLAYLQQNTPAEIMGCLDADSTVDPHALRASIAAFQKSPTIMAVMPAMSILEPKSLWQHMQKVEYEMMTFGKQVFHNIQSIFVAPGPFALFRKEVFEILGPYREAYHTEDLEICLRMIMQGMQIAFAHDAYVYTHGPKTFQALIKQRVRWIYGFLKNMQDFKSLLFKRKYGDISFFILPMSTFGILSVLVLGPLLIAGIITQGHTFYERVSITGLNFSDFSFFFINTKPHVIIGITSLIVLFVTVFIGRKILNHKRYISVDLITFLLYSFVSLYWTLTAVVHVIRSKKISWR